MIIIYIFCRSFCLHIVYTISSHQSAVITLLFIQDQYFCHHVLPQCSSVNIFVFTLCDKPSTLSCLTDDLITHTHTHTHTDDDEYKGYWEQIGVTDWLYSGHVCVCVCVCVSVCLSVSLSLYECVSAKWPLLIKMLCDPIGSRMLYRVAVGCW